MNKIFVVIETTQFNQKRDEPGRGERVPARPAVAQQRRQPPADVPLEEIDPVRFRRQDSAIIACSSMADAEEYVNETLMRNPHFKFIICESVAYLETVPTLPIKKMWDENGQLK